MDEEAEAEAVLRGILRKAFPATVARIALEVERLPRFANVIVPVTSESGIGVRVEDLRIVVREELDYRLAKSAEGRGDGT